MAALALSFQLGPMELNDIVVYAGRRYIVVGFDPMSVSPQRAYLRDVKTGEEVPLLYDDLLKEVRNTGGRSRLMHGEQPMECTYSIFLQIALHSDVAEFVHPTRASSVRAAVANKKYRITI